MVSTKDILAYLRAEFLLTEETGAKPVAILEAEIFDHILSRVPIGFFPNDFLAGDFGVEWVDKESEIYKEIQRWKKEKDDLSSPVRSFPSPSDLMRDQFHCFGSYTFAHTCANYERIINEGLTGVLKRIEEERVHCRESEKGHYLHAMTISLHALIKWVRRFADLAQRESERSGSGDERRRLSQIAETCRNLPEKPASTCREALQVLWFVHAAIGISERHDASLSLGRLDQFLFPVFQNDMQRRVSTTDIEHVLTALFRKLNRYGDAACAVNLGGVDHEGKDLFNPLSTLISGIVRKLKLPSPVLAVRIHPGIPRHVLNSMLTPELFVNGQPTFYGEYSSRAAMRKRGIHENELHKWAANSCMGLVMPGEEISDMWGGVVNLLLPLELTVNQGRPFLHNLPIDVQTEPKAEFSSFDELLQTFHLYTEEIIDFCIEQNTQSTEKVSRERPNPFLSALIDNCIETARDRADGGAKYQTIIIEAFGLVNTADALNVIRRLVFESGKYSLMQLVDAAKNGFQNSPKLLFEILDLPKFGNNNPTVDRTAAELADFFADKVIQYNRENRIYAPSFHTLNTHIQAGKKMGASLDGRHEYEPLAKNIGPMLGRAKDGHTSMIQSVTVIDQTRFYGGQAMDLSFDIKELQNESGRRKIAALLQTYFQKGGLQIQVNGIDAKILEKALEYPTHYNDLIVKIAGYSCYFNKLGREVQREMIDRFVFGQ